MNPVTPFPATFDPGRHKLNDAMAGAIPNVTEDPSPSLSFSRLFTLAEIEAAKDKLRSRFDSAVGDDGISYADIYDMSNECLQTLCNCYRSIGLEPCMLKFMTLLINERVVKWADELHLIPPSQNGFRTGFRSNNNMFILRTALDKANATGNTLYVAYVDMTNAFPFTDHSTLWIKLQRMGAGGFIFD
ncbi:hypothetical protein BKA70DRAFT_1157487, partial [Coprinopsis sp. MPI-PUGE-AT-0042]